MTATFIEGSNSATVEIQITNDNIVEGNEEFTLILDLLPTSGLGIMLGACSTATAVIIDTRTYVKTRTSCICGHIIA